MLNTKRRRIRILSRGGTTYCPQCKDYRKVRRIWGVLYGCGNCGCKWEERS